MELNNGLMIYKSKCLSFINKRIIILLLGILLIIILPCSYLVFKYWTEMPILIKIFWPIMSIIIFIGIIITPLNGMIITKKGTLWFIPDFRILRFNINYLNRLSIIFSEWENNKYSVQIKIIDKDGKTFYKDYSKQFKNIRKNKKLLMAIYTISKRKANKICNKLLDLDICFITIIDKNKNIIYQKNNII